jgi:hypothetical protein
MNILQSGGVLDRLLNLIEQLKAQLWHSIGVLAHGRGFPVVVQGMGERPPVTLWQSCGLAVIIISRLK